MEVLKLEEAWIVRLNNIYSNLLRIFLYTYYRDHGVLVQLIKVTYKIHGIQP